MLLAIDPGLAKCGAVALDHLGRIRFADVLVTEVGERAKPAPGLFRGKKRKPGKVIGGAAADTDRRIRELAIWLDNLITEFRPAAIVAEAAGGSKGGRAATALAAANAVVVLATSLPFVESLPCAGKLVRVHVQTWRRTVVPGQRKISDQELYAAIGAPAAALVHQQLVSRGKSPALAVHALDAVGIGRWALGYSSVVRRAMGIDEGGL